METVGKFFYDSLEIVTKSKMRISKKVKLRFTQLKKKQMYLNKRIVSQGSLGGYFYSLFLIKRSCNKQEHEPKKRVLSGTLFQEGIGAWEGKSN